jgi:hypothetical protein
MIPALTLLRTLFYGRSAHTAVFLSLIGALRSSLRTQADLALENLALRQQLAQLPQFEG